MRDFVIAVSTGELGVCYDKYDDVSVCERGWKIWMGTRLRLPTTKAGVMVDCESPRAVDVLLAELASPVGDRSLPALELPADVVARGLIERIGGIGSAARAPRNSSYSAPLPPSSRYRGVAWHKPRRNWKARCKNGDREYNLGYFADEREAARAYDTYVSKIDR